MWQSHGGSAFQGGALERDCAVGELCQVFKKLVDGQIERVGLL